MFRTITLPLAFALLLTTLAVIAGCAADQTVPAQQVASADNRDAAPLSEQETPPPVDSTDNAAESPTVAANENASSPRNPFRPPTVKTRTVTPQQAQTADIRLLGIAKRGDQPFALLEANGDFQRAVVGDFVLQWEVLSVTDSQATLRRGLEQITLQLN